MELLYDFIKKYGKVSKNIIGLFVSKHPEECTGALDKLIEAGKVIEVQEDLFQVVDND